MFTSNEISAAAVNNTMPLKNTQQESNNSIRDEDDVFFIGATQDIINPTNSKNNIEQKLPKFNFRHSSDPSKEISNPQTSNTTDIMKNNEEDDKFDAATELLNIQENPEFNRRSSTPKAKQNERNKTLNDEDDVFFVCATQDIMNNSEEIKSISPDLDYYSEQVNDGIPEMPCFEVEMYPERYLENQNSQEKPRTQDFGKEISSEVDKNGDTDTNTNSSALKKVQNSKTNAEPLKNLENIDFSAPTQLLGPKSLLEPKQQISAISKNDDTTLNMSKPTENNSISSIKEDNFDVETQIINVSKVIKKQEGSKEIGVSYGVSNADFSALTEKLDKTGSFSESEMFVAPTQEILNNVSHEKVSPTKSFEVGNTSKDEIFMAPTQELIVGKMQKEAENRKDSTDSNDSDIVIKKRKPQMIKETQDTQSDSDSEIGYKRKKCLPIKDSQQTQDFPTLSNIIRNCANDSAIISDLGEETEESMRLVLSNCSINISGKSQNTSNISAKEADTQLELNLPSQKVFIISQNNRPSNPLAQVLDPEIQKLDMIEEDLGPNKYKTKRFVYDLEPTQIFEEKHDTSFEEIPDSDPEDYGEFCEMETQPIGGTTPTPIKEAKTPETTKPKRSRKSKLEPKTWGQTQIENLISNDNVPVKYSDLNLNEKRSTPKKEENLSGKDVPSIVHQNENRSAIPDHNPTEKTSKKEENLPGNSMVSRETSKKQKENTTITKEDKPVNNQKEPEGESSKLEKKLDKTDQSNDKKGKMIGNDEPSTSSRSNSVASVSKQIHNPECEVIVLEDTQEIVDETKNNKGKEVPVPEVSVEGKVIGNDEPSTSSRSKSVASLSKQVRNLECEVIVIEDTQEIGERKNNKGKELPVPEVCVVETKRSTRGQSTLKKEPSNTSKRNTRTSTVPKEIEKEGGENVFNPKSTKGKKVPKEPSSSKCTDELAKSKETKNKPGESLLTEEPTLIPKRNTRGSSVTEEMNIQQAIISTLKETVVPKQKSSTDKKDSKPTLVTEEVLSKTVTRRQSTSATKEVLNALDDIIYTKRSTRGKSNIKEEPSKEKASIVKHSTRNSSSAKNIPVSDLSSEVTKKSTRRQSTSKEESSIAEEILNAPEHLQETKRSTRTHLTSKEESITSEKITPTNTELKKVIDLQESKRTRGQSTTKEEGSIKKRDPSVTKEVSNIPKPKTKRSTREQSTSKEEILILPVPQETMRSTRGQSATKEVSNPLENITGTKRSLRGQSTSKEEPIPAKTRASSVAKEVSTLPVNPPETKRSKRGQSISKEEPSAVTKKLINPQENKRSTRKESTSKEVPNTLENTNETKRSTRGHSASKDVPTSKKTRAPSLPKEDIPETKKPRRGQNTKRESSITRSTRASSVTKENAEPKTSRRKTLGSISEDHNQPGTSGLNETILVEMKPSRLSTGKAAEIIETIDDTTDEKNNVKKTGRKTALEKTADKNVEQKEHGTTQNTRRKIKIDSSSSENETPTKRSRRNPEDQDSEASQESTPRRDTRLKHKVVFTMLDDANLEATVGRLGGKTVDSSKECTVLVTSKISRSLKFLVAVSLGKPIVGPDWVRACSHAHKFLDPWDFILNDNETEKKLNFKLREAIEKGANTKMFDGYIFLILVNKNFEVIKNVIEACGGETVTKVPKNTQKTFIIISYPEDKSKYSRYLKQNPPVTVVGAEAIFAGALQQKLILDEHYLQ